MDRLKRRRRDSSNWQRTAVKKARQSGKEYKDRAGRMQGARIVKPGCYPNCRLKCSTKFDEEARKLINESFWKLNDNQKSHFYNKSVKKIPTKGSKVQFLYFFEIKNDEFQVCAKFYLSTLNISKSRIAYFHSNFKSNVNAEIRAPLTGHHIKKVTKDEVLDNVRNHIMSFPVMESHYSRRDSSKLYLEANLSKQKMYRLYSKESTSPCKIGVYLKVSLLLY